MSTKMMPVPALEQLEREISAVLNNMTDIRREGRDTVYTVNTNIVIQDLNSSLREMEKLKSLWLNKKKRAFLIKMVNFDMTLLTVEKLLVTMLTFMFVS